MKKIKILHLPLEAKWYKMIESGVKKEEYREIKPYWVNRLARCYKWCALSVLTHLDRCKQCHTDFNDIRTNGYTHVKFSYGYTKRNMTFEIESITIGKGKLEWGAPDEEVFKIKLGKRL
jgi:hypothetical protein